MSAGAYFRVLNAASSVIIKTELDDMDAFARDILDYIGMQQAGKRSLRVKDIIARYVVASTAPTIYARLQKLEEDGWIYYRADPNDGRVKLVRLSDRAHGLYARIDRAVAKAMESEHA